MVHGLILAWLQRCGLGMLWMDRLMKEKVLLNLCVEDYIQQRLGSLTPNCNLNGWIPAGPSWNITAVNKSRRAEE